MPDTSNYDGNTAALRSYEAHQAALPEDDTRNCAMCERKDAREDSRFCSLACETTWKRARFFEGRADGVNENRTAVEFELALRTIAAMSREDLQLLTELYDASTETTKSTIAQMLATLSIYACDLLTAAEGERNV